MWEILENDWRGELLISVENIKEGVVLMVAEKLSSAWMNFAHTYLLNGQFEKANPIYEKYAGTAFAEGRKRNNEVRSGFRLLRKAGHDRSDMNIKSTIDP